MFCPFVLQHGEVDVLKELQSVRKSPDLFVGDEPIVV